MTNVTAPATGSSFGTRTIAAVEYPYMVPGTVVAGVFVETSAAAPQPVDAIASTYAKVIPSNVVTRPANTTAYATGQIVGVTGGGATGRFALTSAARINGGAVRIDRIRLYKSQATALGAFQLWVYRGDPATVGIADQATTLSQLTVGGAAASLRLIGRVNFDMTGAALGTDGAEVSGIPIIGPALLAAAGSAETTLYGVLATTGAYTPVSGETFSVVMEGYSF